MLAVRLDLTSRRTLTAVHDNEAAWSGLGSSILTLYRNTRVRSQYMAGPMVAAVYLAGIAGLGISIPTLLVIQPFNETSSQTVATTGGPDTSNMSSLTGYMYVSLFHDHWCTEDAF